MAGDEEEVLHHGGSKGLSDLSALPSPIIVSRQFSNDSSQDTPMEAISEMPSFAGSLRSLESSASSVSGKESKSRKHKVKGQTEMKTKDGAEEDEEDAFKPK